MFMVLSLWHWDSSPVSFDELYNQAAASPNTVTTDSILVSAVGYYRAYIYRLLVGLLLTNQP